MDSTRETNRRRLTEYARELARAGFQVWLTPTNYRDAGYLTYHNPEADTWGTFQRSEFEGWQHFMPIKPSREFGSSMFLETETDPWTVEAARECARPTNSNSVIGTHANAKAYRSPRAEVIDAE